MEDPLHDEYCREPPSPNEESDEKSSCLSDRRFAFQAALPGGEGRDRKMDNSQMELGASHCAALNPFRGPS